MMLRFSEDERPSFIELGKIVLTSCENTIESNKEEAADPTKPEKKGPKANASKKTLAS
jgi:hypothetical protein